MTDETKPDSSQSSLEDRVATLERTVAELVSHVGGRFNIQFGEVPPEAPALLEGPTADEASDAGTAEG